MIRHITRNTWIGVGMLAVAAIYYSEAGKIRTSALDDPVGASGLPKALGIAMAVLAVLLILRDLTGAFIAARRNFPTAASARPATLGEVLRPHFRAAGMFGLGIGYLLVISTLGYAVSIALLLLAVSLYIGAPLGLRTLLVAVIGGVLYHLLFVEFLGIRLPQGLLFGMLGG